MEVGAQHTKFNIVPENKQKKRGCFFYGCLTLIVVVVLGVIGLYFGFRYATESFVEKYSSATSLNLPAPSITKEKYPELEAKLNEFIEATNKGTATAPLILTADDLNAVVHFHPQFKAIAGRVLFNIEGERIGAKVSVPLEPYGFPGKFMNGEATVLAVLEYGLLKVNLDQFSLNGQAAPDAFLADVRKENIAYQWSQDPKIKEAIGKLQSIVVKDGKITVTPK